MDVRDDVACLSDDSELKHRVDGLKVVNDSAERAIALIKRFQKSVNNEEQKQFLLRVVNSHREAVPKRTKAQCIEYRTLFPDS